jgi:ribosomal protein L40E
MRGQIESLLYRGIEAARAHEKARARDIFIHIIELDERNEQAWLWLSSVVETLADKEVCLENVLHINPENTYAGMGLRHVRLQEELRFSPPSVLPRLAGQRTSVEREWGSSEAAVSPPPAVRICPRCEFRNPGWAYLCDRCGANLRQVDVRKAVGTAAQPRGRSFITLLDAWGGVFVFNRVYAFGPEVELASWGRSAAALIMAALFASIWRAAMSFVLWLLTGGGAWRDQIAVNALRAAAQTLPPALLLILMCVPIALLMFVVARLVGGKQGFKTHLHLTAVAFSAWVMLIALLAPLTVLLPFILGGTAHFDLPFDVVSVAISVAVSATGPIWLIQAVRTAQQLSFTRAIGATLLIAVLTALLLVGLDALTGGGFADFLGGLVVAPFLPLPNLEA